jgi:hypothetical protein
VNGVDMPRTRFEEAINIEWVEWLMGYKAGTHCVVDATVNKHHHISSKKTSGTALYSFQPERCFLQQQCDALIMVRFRIPHQISKLEHHRIHPLFPTVPP